MTGPVPLRLRRCVIAGEWEICGSALRIKTGAPYRLTVASRAPATEQWLDETGLHNVEFARRRDLLIAVHAHTAIRPLPAEDADCDEQQPVRLIRRPDGSHVTAEGDYTVTLFQTADPFIRQVVATGVWEVEHLPADGPPVQLPRVPSLRQAAQQIADDRSWRLQPEPVQAFWGRAPDELLDRAVARSRCAAGR